MKDPLSPPLDLKYYLFDWDDNVLYMPTKIKLEKDSEPIEVTTKEYYTLRNEAGITPSEGSWEKAFVNFDDDPKKMNFLNDMMIAIRSKSFAPSFQAFKEAIINGRLFCILSARGHDVAVFRQAVELFIHIELDGLERATMFRNLQKFNKLAGLDIPTELVLEKYLDLNGYIGVSNPQFRKDFPSLREAVSPARGKKLGMKQFVERTLKLVENFKGHDIQSISFGFSDNDPGNLEEIKNFMKEDLQSEYPDIKFSLFDTSEGHTKKMEIHNKK